MSTRRWIIVGARNALDPGWCAHRSRNSSGSNAPEAADTCVDTEVARGELVRPGLAQDIQRMARRTGVSLNRLVVEVTESVNVGVLFLEK